MSRGWVVTAGALAAMLTAGLTGCGDGGRQQSHTPPSPRQQTLVLEPGVGNARLIARGSGGTLALRDAGPAFTLRHGRRSAAVTLELPRAVRPTPELRLPGVVNDYRGSDPAKWRTALPTHGRARYREVWPGIDVIVHGDGRRVEYDFVVRPGADPRDIVLRVGGNGHPRIDRRGRLVVDTRAGRLVQHAPTLYQQVAGHRRGVGGGFRLDGRILRYRVGRYDHRRTLVIDPVVVWSTYNGGTGTDLPSGVTAAPDGTVVVAGTADGTVPTVNEIPGSPTFGGWVTKFAADGSSRVFSTLIDGEQVRAVTRTANGDIVVVGRTYSSSFGATPGGDQINDGNGDGFVVVLSPAGALLRATLIGGADDDDVLAVAPAADGDGFAIAGRTGSIDFPTTGGVAQSVQGGAPSTYDAFITTFGAGVTPTASTLYGGTGDDSARGLAYDANTGAYVLAGDTTSPALPGGSPTNLGSADAFAARLPAALTTPTWVRLLGGSGVETTGGVAIDGDGDAIVAGSTESADLVTTNAFDDTLGQTSDAFVAKLNGADGAREVVSYLGESTLNEHARAVAVSPTSGRVWVVGDAGSDNSDQDSTLWRLEPELTGVVDTLRDEPPSDEFNQSYDSYAGVAFGGGDAYVAGNTTAADFTVTDGVVQPAHADDFGSNDQTVQRLQDENPADLTPPETTIQSGPTGAVRGATQQFTFSSTEPGTFSCVLDGVTTSNCTSPFEAVVSTTASHTFSVTATDLAGNPDDSPPSRVYSVYALAPTQPDTVIDSGPDGKVAATTQTFTFSASPNEAGVTFECSSDGAAYAECSSPLELKDLTTGAHVFRVRLKDAGGQVDPTPAERAYEIGTETATTPTPPPGTTSTDTPPPPPADAAPVARLDAPAKAQIGDIVTVDASGSFGSGASYDWDFDGDGSYDLPGSRFVKARLKVNGAGPNVVTVRVTDNAGRTSVASATVNVAAPLNIDSTSIPDRVAPGATFKVALTASAPDDKIDYYTFDFGDGAAPAKTILGNLEFANVYAARRGSMTHRYKKAGTYKASFGVHTADGQQQSIKQTIVVKAGASSRAAASDAFLDGLAACTGGSSAGNPLVPKKLTMLKAPTPVLAETKGNLRGGIYRPKDPYCFKAPATEIHLGGINLQKPAVLIGLVPDKGDPPLDNFAPEVTAVNEVLNAAALSRGTVKGVATTSAKALRYETEFVKKTVDVMTGNVTYSVAPQGNPGAAVVKSASNGVQPDQSVELSFPKNGIYDVTVKWVGYSPAEAHEIATQFSPLQFDDPAAVEAQLNKHPGEERAVTFKVMVLEPVCTAFKLGGAYTVSPIDKSGYGCLLPDVNDDSKLSGDMNVGGIELYGAVLDRDPNAAGKFEITDATPGTSVLRALVHPVGTPVSNYGAAVPVGLIRTVATIPPKNGDGIVEGIEVAESDGITFRGSPVLGTSVKIDASGVTATPEVELPQPYGPETADGNAASGSTRPEIRANAPGSGTQRAVTAQAPLKCDFFSEKSKPVDLLYRAPLDFTLCIKHVPMGPLEAREIELTTYEDKCSCPAAGRWVEGGGTINFLPLNGLRVLLDGQGHDSEGFPKKDGFGIHDGKFSYIGADAEFDKPFAIGPVGVKRLFAKVALEPDFFFQGAFKLVYPAVQPAGQKEPTATINGCVQIQKITLKKGKTRDVGICLDPRVDGFSTYQAALKAEMLLESFGKHRPINTFVAKDSQFDVFVIGDLALLGIPVAEAHVFYLDHEQSVVVNNKDYGHKVAQLGGSVKFDVADIISMRAELEVTAVFDPKFFFQFYGKATGCVVGLCGGFEALVNNDWAAGCISLAIASGGAAINLHDGDIELFGKFGGCSLRSKKYYYNALGRSALLPDYDLRSPRAAAPLPVDSTQKVAPDPDAASEVFVVRGTSAPPKIRLDVPAGGGSPARSITVDGDDVVRQGGLFGYRGVPRADQSFPTVGAAGGSTRPAVIPVATRLLENTSLGQKQIDVAKALGLAATVKTIPTGFDTARTDWHVGEGSGSQNMTVIEVPKPAAGNYVLHNLDPSNPVQTFESHSAVLEPDAVAKARMEESDALNALAKVNYRMTLGAGEGGRIVEESVNPKDGVSRQLTTVKGPGSSRAMLRAADATEQLARMAAAGQKRTIAKTLRFTPAPGPKGKRKIVFYPTRNGMPLKPQVLATYTAPAQRTTPRPIGRLIASRQKGKSNGLKIKWLPSPDASGYKVDVTFSDGRVVHERVGAKVRNHRVRTFPLTSSATVVVTPVTKLSTGGTATKRFVKAAAKKQKRYVAVGIKARRKK